MEGLQSFFKPKGRHRDSATHGQGLSSLPSTYPLTPKVLTPDHWPAKHESQPLNHFTSIPHNSQTTDVHHNSTLVEKLAARFVLGQNFAEANKKETPVSRGDSKVERRKLFKEYDARKHAEFAGSECWIRKDTVDGLMSTNVGKVTMVTDSTPVKDRHGSVKDDRSVLGVLVLVWLINQREILKDLTDLRDRSIHGQKILQTSQESSQGQLTSLGQQIVSVHKSLHEQQSHMNSQMTHLKRLVSVFGLVQIFFLVSMVAWSNKGLRKSICTWVVAKYHLMRSGLSMWLR